MDTTWLTAYLSLIVEVDGPVLEALSVYWKHVQATVDQLLPSLVLQQGSMVHGITDLDPVVKLCLVARDGMTLRCIHPIARDATTCKVAVRQNPHALQWVRVQTRELCLEAIRAKPATLEYVTLADSGLFLEAVRLNPIALKYIPAHLRTYETYRVAVEQDGMMLEYVPVTVQWALPHLCLTAVRQEGLALEYVCSDQRTPALLVAAVSQNPLALAYILEPTPELLLTAATAYLKQVADTTPGVQSDLQAVINRVWAITNRVST